MVRQGVHANLRADIKRQIRIVRTKQVFTRPMNVMERKKLCL
ncbi:hypothetical protein ACS15_5150 [Ralstonia insidiosa]|uniref:Uncharacterized protein n=1 Tax=Ralstonia insidiosa TaxID=190721 RepID=A0AAC9FU35_9RALS|nr:hypothetical protein ACS15_5150 [Ralstonia insidiosa]